MTESISPTNRNKVSPDSMFWSGRHSDSNNTSCNLEPKNKLTLIVPNHYPDDLDFNVHCSPIVKSTISPSKRNSRSSDVSQYLRFHFDHSVRFMYGKFGKYSDETRTCVVNDHDSQLSPNRGHQNMKRVFNFFIGSPDSAAMISPRTPRFMSRPTNGVKGKNICILTSHTEENNSTQISDVKASHSSRQESRGSWFEDFPIAVEKNGTGVKDDQSDCDDLSVSSVSTDDLHEFPIIQNENVCPSVVSTPLLLSIPEKPQSSCESLFNSEDPFKYELNSENGVACDISQLLRDIRAVILIRFKDTGLKLDWMIAHDENAFHCSYNTTYPAVICFIILSSIERFSKVSSHISVFFGFRRKLNTNSRSQNDADSLKIGVCGDLIVTFRFQNTQKHLEQLEDNTHQIHPIDGVYDKFFSDWNSLQDREDLVDNLLDNVKGSKRYLELFAMNSFVGKVNTSNPLISEPNKSLDYSIPLRFIR